MKTSHSSRFLLLAAVVAAASFSAAPAHARSRARTAVGERGTFTRQVDRAPGSVARAAAATNAEGQVATHRYQRTVDPAAGSVSASASTMLRDGRTAGRTFSSQATDRGRVTAAQATGPGGRTVTLDSGTTRTDHGRSLQTTLTGPDGATASTQVDITREAGTVTRTVTRTAEPKP